MLARSIFIAYDTACLISIKGLPQTLARQVLEEAEEIAHSVEILLNMYDEESELSILCRDYEVGQAYPVSEELFLFLQENFRLSKLTGGLFDPTIGKVVQLWDFLGDDRTPPSDKKLKEALKYSGAAHVSLDSKDKTVTFLREGIEIDPGASGKGYALDLVANFLKGQEVREGVLNFGNSLSLIGRKSGPEGISQPWTVAIRNPDDLDGILGVAEADNLSISTSSWYEHYFEHEGIRYHHLLNPETGMPCPMQLKSVTVLSSSGLLSDLLSTCLFILGEEKGHELVKEVRSSSGETVEFVALRQDNTIVRTEGATFRIPDEHFT